MSPVAEQLYMPFPVRQHPLAAQVQEVAAAWAHRHGLGNETKVHHYGQFMAMVYPDADLDRLRTIAESTGWLFAVDDVRDESGVGADPAALEAYDRRLFDIFLGRALPHSPIERAAADVARRIGEDAPSREWHRDWLACLAQYFRGNWWEAANRRAGRVPPRDEYMMWRPDTTSMYLYLQFGGFGQRYALDAFERSALLRRLEDHCNNVVGFGNDLASLDKEEATGDYHNLVIVIEHEGVSREAARAEAIAIHNREVRQWEHWRAQMPQPLVENVRRQLQVHMDWMSANTEWGKRTARYVRT